MKLLRKLQELLEILYELAQAHILEIKLLHTSIANLRPTITILHHYIHEILSIFGIHTYSYLLTSYTYLYQIVIIPTQNYICIDT